MENRLTPEAQAALDAVRRRLAGFDRHGPKDGPPSVNDVLDALAQAITALDARLTKLEQR